MPHFTDCSNQLPPGTFALIEVLGGDEMKRDDELIRSILIEMEDDPEPVKVYPNDGSAERRRIHFHVQLLVDAGLVVPLDSRGCVYRLSNAGFDFLAAIRDDTIWRKMRAATAGAGEFGLGLLRDVGLGYLRAKLIDMGVPLG